VSALAGIAIAAALLLGLEADGAQNAVLCLAPAIVLLALLSGRRYPGERILLRVRRRASRCEKTAARVHAPRPPRPARRAMPRGGVLVGCSLAGRAPPACAAP
jgi:hypothetical protein